MTTEQEARTYEYWQWKQAIPPAVCEQLLREIGELTLGDAVVGYNAEAEINPELRNNKTVFLESNHWFEGILLNHARYANQSAMWGFAVDGVQPLQVAVYDPDTKYDWHTDDSIMSRAKPYQRKLTAVCQLSDPKDFTGGGLYLRGIDESLLVNQGDLVVFPSFMEHKAEVVETGRRVTAVCWVTGKWFT